MLASFLFGDYRQKVLALLLSHPELRYHVREIARLTGTSAGTLHKELARLALAGVLFREGREINPVVLSPTEFRQKASMGDPFLTNVLNNEKLFLMGNERDLGKLAGNQASATA